MNRRALAGMTLLLGTAPAGAAEPPAAIRARAIGVGEHYSCALLDDGDVRCWGAARLQAQRGSTRPISIGVPQVVSLAVGPRHACVATAAGAVLCWGQNRNGELGDGATVDRFAPAPVAALARVRIVEVAAGGVHTCARDGSGAVYCWGHSGCAGGGTSRPVLPRRVAPLPPIARLVAGDDITCAIPVSGGVPACWGFNTTGLLGDALGPVLRPIPVKMLARASALAIGMRHACYVEAERAFCGGGDQFGQLGDQLVPDDAQCDSRDREVKCTWRDPRPPPPVSRRLEVRPPERWPPVVEPPPAVHSRAFPVKQWFVPVQGNVPRPAALAAGYGRSCAVTDERRVVCWGQWYHGIDWSHRTPQPMPGIEDAISVAVYEEHGCALRADGAVLCFGFNRSGELGDGAPTHELQRVPGAIQVRW